MVEVTDNSLSYRKHSIGLMYDPYHLSEPEEARNLRHLFRRKPVPLQIIR